MKAPVDTTLLERVQAPIGLEKNLSKKTETGEVQRKKGDKVENKTNDIFLEWPHGSFDSTNIFFLPKQPRTLN